MKSKWDRRHEEFEETLRAADWGSLIRFAREACGVTQFDLACEMGCGQSVIARMERNGNVPTVRTLAKIAAQTGGVLTITMQGQGRSHTVAFDGEAYRRRRERILRGRWLISKGEALLRDP